MESRGRFGFAARQRRVERFSSTARNDEIARLLASLATGEPTMRGYAGPAGFASVQPAA